MRRPIDEQITVAGSAADLAAVLHRSPDQWLPQPVARTPGDRDEWQTVAWAGSLGVFVGCVVGQPYPGDGGTWRMLRWAALSPEGLAAPLVRAAPSFDGHLGLLPEGEGAATLVLRGDYTPPSRLLGGLAAICGLGRVACSTARQFLQDVAGRLLEAVEGAGSLSPAGVVA